jgi:hypothetical protein
MGYQLVMNVLRSQGFGQLDAQLRQLRHRFFVHLGKDLQLLRFTASGP